MERGGGEGRRGKKENSFQLEGSFTLLGAEDLLFYHLRVMRTYGFRILIPLCSLLVALHLSGLSHGVICSGKHEEQQSVVLKNTRRLGFESWLSTS